MSFELLYTSAPSGLKQGSRGFSTVLCTQGAPSSVTSRLETLSGFRHVFPPGDPRASLNPITWSHVRIAVGGRSQSVLSRIAAYGVDYSGRTNKLAHHLVLETGELPEAGPAWLLAQPGLMRSEWDGQTVAVPTGPSIPRGEQTPGICERWRMMTGDAGLGGVVAKWLADGSSQPSWILFAPEQSRELLPLLSESIALLPLEKRWRATFSTYFTSLPPEIDCQIRCVLAGTDEAQHAVTRGQWIDLTRPMPMPPGNSWVTRARTGQEAMRPWEVRSSDILEDSYQRNFESNRLAPRQRTPPEALPVSPPAIVAPSLVPPPFPPGVGPPKLPPSAVSESDPRGTFPYVPKRYLVITAALLLIVCLGLGAGIGALIWNSSGKQSVDLAVNSPIVADIHGVVDDGSSQSPDVEVTKDDQTPGQFEATRHEAPIGENLRDGSQDVDASLANIHSQSDNAQPTTNNPDRSSGDDSSDRGEASWDKTNPADPESAAVSSRNELSTGAESHKSATGTSETIEESGISSRTKVASEGIPVAAIELPLKSARVNTPSTMKSHSRVVFDGTPLQFPIDYEWQPNIEIPNKPKREQMRRSPAATGTRGESSGDRSIGQLTVPRVLTISFHLNDDSRELHLSLDVQLNEHRSMPQEMIGMINSYRMLSSFMSELNANTSAGKTSSHTNLKGKGIELTGAFSQYQSNIPKKLRDAKKQQSELQRLIQNTTGNVAAPVNANHHHGEELRKVSELCNKLEEANKAITVLKDGIEIDCGTLTLHGTSPEGNPMEKTIPLKFRLQLNIEDEE